ncbi:XRE family transcriptional regulator [Brevibacillus laterosporus]|uniref:XRE family transcriptional regulator n=1 Tax=Brevibacillus laterosporus TaxID=1465 RepID=A0A518V314_BRELA|nr:helix-turn-helix transcriptional regulator [Brevibacillus laterosporus]QDX91369.1 XRE family transcriptional regulator [Brevibacillus laterosporus]TPG69757.1 XRE family transcriptional regulator [Brevibacillus laterosporus]
MADSLTFTTLGELIKEKREEFGISLSELSRRSGVSKGIISKIESGETKRPELKNLKLLADPIKIPYEEIIDRYIDVELRTDILEAFLAEAIEIANISLLTKVAVKFLGNPKKDTYTLLEDLYSLTATIENNEVRVALYNVIVNYARVRGIPMYIAKSSLQKYLIERQDFKTMEESFKIGEETIHYVDFLSEDERVILYFSMALQAFAIKKYQKCIELCEAGIPLEEKDSELKARAYLAMINSLYFLGLYDELEGHLTVYKTFDFQFVHESATLTSATVKAKKKEYETAIPLLLECLQNTSKGSKIHAVNELFELYLQIEKFDSIAELISQEDNFLIMEAITPYKYYSMGLYYQYKGAYQILVESFQEGLESYLTGMSVYGKINAYQEINECMKSILSYHFSEKKSVDLQMVQKLQEVYNGITQNKIIS